jgi:hypothetical protein
MPEVFPRNRRNRQCRNHIHDQAYRGTVQVVGAATQGWRDGELECYCR